MDALDDFAAGIRPRSDWAYGLDDPGQLPREKDGDVRFLLVHHTETPNGESGSKAIQRLRGIHAYHTSAEKGWADIAYNFLIDAEGTVWEGRAGSLDGPVIGDATGGNQGFDQLACLIGSFMTVEPTPAALDATTNLLAWLARRYGVAIDSDEVSFVSRGSNKWPKGRTVVTTPIAGHRDMSQTSCPGDAFYPLLAARLLPDVRSLLASLTPAPEPSPSATETPSESATPTPTETASPSPASSSAPPPAVQPTPSSSPGTAPSSGEFPALPVGVGAVGTLLLGATAWYVRRRRMLG